MLKTFDARPFLLAEATRIVSQIATEIEIAVKTEMLKPKHGRRYGSHIASAAGEAPAVDSAHYIKNIDIDIQKDHTSVVAFVGVKDTPYAIRLETTMNRPVWQPVSRRVAKEFRNRSRRRGR